MPGTGSAHARDAPTSHLWPSSPPTAGADPRSVTSASSVPADAALTSTSNPTRPNCGSRPFTRSLPLRYGHGTRRGAGSTTRRYGRIRSAQNEVVPATATTARAPQAQPRPARSTKPVRTSRRRAFAAAGPFRGGLAVRHGCCPNRGHSRRSAEKQSQRPQRYHSTDENRRGGGSSERVAWNHRSDSAPTERARG